MSRKARFSPNPTAKDVKLNVTKHSLDVLQAIFEQELIRSTHLDHLLPHRHFFGLRQTLARLHKAGMVSKVRDATQNIYCPDIYYLTPEGEKFLTECRGELDRYVCTYRPREDYRIEFQHKLGIADTIANLRAGAVENGCRFISQGEIERSHGLNPGEPLKLPATAEKELGGQFRSWKGDLEPDGLFGIEYPDGTKTFIALEYQRTGKIRVNALYGVSSMLRKYLAYANIYQNKTFKTEWGIPNLRVLFVFSQPNDHNQSLKLGAELFPKGSPMFLHIHQPAHHETKSGLLVAPKPNPSLFTEPLNRAGLEPATLFDTKKVPT